MKDLLFDEKALIVSPKLAAEIGLCEAILLQQIHDWIDPKKNTNFAENRYWVCISYAQMHKYLECFAEVTIRKAIKALEKQELLISKNFNTYRFDKTKWYTINYDQVANLKTNHGV